MKTALVTGATGFIGRFLVRELIEQGIDVIAVVRKDSRNLDAIAALPIETVECDLMQIRNLMPALSKSNIDAIFHMAWQGVSDADARDEEIQIKNLQATLALLDMANELNIGTFVGCGSIHEAEGILEMNENKVISNMGYMYKAAKIAAHWMGKAKAGNYGIRFFWPLINTYGEEEQSARLINTVIRKMLSGERPAVSKGEQFYDFVHVSDVARALYLIAENGMDGTNYVIGSGEAKPLKEYLLDVERIVNTLIESDVKIKFGAIKSNVISLPKETFDISELVNDTGFRPLISFDEGIKRTTKWIMITGEGKYE